MHRRDKRRTHRNFLRPIGRLLQNEPKFGDAFGLGEEVPREIRSMRGQFYKTNPIRRRVRRGEDVNAQTGGCVVKTTMPICHAICVNDGFHPS
jgi:hypothetical protein